MTSALLRKMKLQGLDVANGVCMFCRNLEEWKEEVQVKYCKYENFLFTQVLELGSLFSLRLSSSLSLHPQLASPTQSFSLICHIWT